MLNINLLILVSLFFAHSFSPLSPDDSKIDKKCCYKGMKLYGKIKFVDNFPDIKVQIVENFPDLKVKLVENFPDECGKWKVVENFPDLKVQIVTSFPNIKVKFVDNFPGLP
jgi:acylphosphatase